MGKCDRCFAIDAPSAQTKFRWMFNASDRSTLPKAEIYKNLATQLHALIDDEPDAIANMANCASLIFNSLPGLNWAGFYLLREDVLVLGPFQGKPACIRIPMGRGVCGAAAEKRETIRVADVNAFPDHIPCDSASQSEIVIPLVPESGCLIGVLDVDSPMLDRFDDEDQRGLEAFATIIAAKLG